MYIHIVNEFNMNPSVAVQLSSVRSLETCLGHCYSLLVEVHVDLRLPNAAGDVFFNSPENV